MMVREPYEFTPEQVLVVLGSEYVLKRNKMPNKRRKRTTTMVLGHPVYRESLRYMTFFQKGMECVSCGRVGTKFYLQGDDLQDRRHFALYSDDGVLMTRDHILPKGRGGRDTFENSQTMCEICNQAKGDTPEEETLAEMTPEERERALIDPSIESQRLHYEAQHLARLRALELKVDWLLQRQMEYAGLALEEDSLKSDMEQWALYTLKPSLINPQTRHHAETLSKRASTLESYIEKVNRVPEEGHRAYEAEWETA